MQIEEGKYYKTRDGRKVGPRLVWNEGSAWPWSDHEADGTDIWDDNGRSDYTETPNDLLEEWAE